MGENKAQRHKGVMRETFDGGVFMNILSRLSVKCICSFKLVSKYWHNMISDKYFAKKQLAQSRENPTFISCPTVGPVMKLYSMRPESFELFKLNTIDPAERSQGSYMYMISSFNGLICCINHVGEEVVGSEFCDLQIWICNPCTGETLLLPQGTPSYVEPSAGVEPSVGVTYASDTSDYKVYRIFCAGRKIPKDIVSREFRFGSRYITKNFYAMDYECEVYSSITGSWKNIGPVPRAPMRAGLSLYRSCHAFVGGKLFWLISLDEPDGILSIDLKGRCEDVKLPHYDHKIMDYTYLTVLQGSLSLVTVRFGSIIVWVWKVEDKDWSKLRTNDDISIPFGANEDELVLAVTTLKNQIIFVTDTYWWKYDVDTGEWDRNIGPPSGFVFPSVFPFTESLLPCKGGVML